jgi:uncharacterized protein YbaR (Trm112 family)
LPDRRTRLTDFDAVPQAKQDKRPMTTPEDMSQTVDPRLLEVLVCPLTKTTLRYDRERQELISDAARLAFPIREGVPIMLPDEARVLED